ncbi:MAG: SDR family oxidoreductase [Deltaproteobacteria bacterium]|nr:SDR family oxidoreductase [Deltaproteobacteria bacterium]
MKFSGKVVLVTGSGQGIGRACALLFACEGASVVVNDIHASLIEDTVKEIQRWERKVLGIQADATTEDEVSRMFARIKEAFGKLDVLVNNVGGSGGGGAGDTSVKIEEVPEEDWDKVIRANLKSTFLCSKKAIELMKPARYGKIVNISSRAARRGTDHQGPQYHTSKSAILGLTRQLARDLAPFGIYVNAVAPGFILSSARAERRWQQRTEEEKQSYLKDIPLGRLGKPEEVAQVVAFLCSDEASYITGVTIDINGGSFMI